MILGRKFTFHHNALILYLLYHEMLGDFVKKNIQINEVCRHNLCSEFNNMD